MKETTFRLPKQTGLSLARSIYEVVNQTYFERELPRIPLRVHSLKNEGVSTNYKIGAEFAVCTRQLSFYTTKDGLIVHHSYMEECPSISIDSSAMYFTDLTGFMVNLTNYILHEMIHEHCYLLGISDCTPNTQYHNARFMLEAESHGLTCNYDAEYGFNRTSVQPEAFNSIFDAIPDEVLTEVLTTASMVIDGN